MPEYNDYQLPDMDEASTSQIPALIQLVNLGYQYLNRAAVEAMRQSASQYILKDIAFSALRKINPTEISDQSIKQAIDNLEKFRLDDGIIKASELLYTDLISGCSVTEFIEGKKTSRQLKFIDFAHPLNNIFNVTAEFKLTEDSSRRPDIVVFVNGIPFAVIENKKPSVSINDATTQMLRNQKSGQVPKFFLFPQILIATNAEELKYGTMLTPVSFYSAWKIRERDKEVVNKIVSCALESQNKPIATDIFGQINADLLRNRYTQSPLGPNAQNIGIYCLLKPENLLDIARNFIIYDNDGKKIARYQQYYAIKHMLATVQQYDSYGRRKGGLIWHTQGSGKSLTMVMLVKNLIETITNPRVIVVTDRRDLDRQIRDTFAACNIKKDVQQAKTSWNLRELIKNKSLDVITAVIKKFEAMKEPVIDKDTNIFVLIDEAHRSQSGVERQKLTEMLPNACFLGFTGTPLMKKDKETTINQFGGLIDAYTISEAEEDGAILPLVYQGLFVEQDANEAMDKFFDKIAEHLSQEQKNELSKKFLSTSLIEETTQRINMIALDVHSHFKDNFQGTGLKAQVVMPSKYSAIYFKKALDLLGGINSAVIISDMPSSEEEADNLPEHKKEVSQFLEEIKRLNGSLEAYEASRIDSFKNDPNGCELIIVVDKLLTGFDAPVNTALYLAKQLKEHNLLQAIARVNRIYEGKPGKKMKINGFIFDYSKNARNLKDALELFSNYDPEDIKRALINTDEKIKALEDIYQNLWDTFKQVKNKDSYDEYVGILKQDTILRKNFYADVSTMIKELDVCRTLSDFYQKVDTEKLKRYSSDLKRFIEIKKVTQTIMSETVDFSKYQDQIRKILNNYVSANDVEQLSKPINISDVAEFNRFIEDQKNGLSTRSKAEAIAAQTEKTIHERWQQDPIFYEKFSKKVKEIIESLKIAKKEDLEALFTSVKDLQKQVDDYEDNDIPETIRDIKTVHPYYRKLRISLKDYSSPDAIVSISKGVFDIISAEKIVDWKENIEVKRIVRNNMEDYFFDIVKNEMKVPITIEMIDSIVDDMWSLAIKND